MLREILVAVRDWLKQHVLRSPDDERYGDLMLFDDTLVRVPKDRTRP